MKPILTAAIPSIPAKAMFTAKVAAMKPYRTAITPTTSSTAACTTNTATTATITVRSRLWSKRNRSGFFRISVKNKRSSENAASVKNGMAFSDDLLCFPSYWEGGGGVKWLYLLFVKPGLLDSYALSFMILISPTNYHLLPLQPYISLSPIRLSQSIGNADCKTVGICSLHSISPTFDRSDISQSLLQSLFIPSKSFMLCLLLEIFHFRAIMY